MTHGYKGWKEGWLKIAKCLKIETILSFIGDLKKLWGGGIEERNQEKGFAGVQQSVSETPNGQLLILLTITMAHREDTSVRKVISL